MNRGENTLLCDACLEALTIGYITEQSILGSYANDKNKKKGDFLLTQVQILKIAEFKPMKIAFYRLSSQLVSSRS